jgi:hypothetical protein
MVCFSSAGCVNSDRAVSGQKTADADTVHFAWRITAAPDDDNLAVFAEVVPERRRGERCELTMPSPS